ncbi:SIMPL domain-containing protein [Salinirarus marinus]|uniref:SIMPL domain-containing protein n=1 Tax=Salinirarus marinus TaxID=3068310 RepID=UPI003C6CA4BA
MHRRTLLAVGLATLLLVAGCAGGSSSAESTATPDERTIQVAGTGSTQAEPNQAVVDVAVVATADDAATARQRLAANASQMRSALTDLGLDDDQITTMRYDINRDRRRPREEGTEPRVQYRASHAFEITLTETDRVGTVVDTAVQNGATEIYDIQFTLSTDRRRSLERDARRAAMTDAREKAENIADAANLTVTGVEVVRTGGGGAPRQYAGGAASATPTAVADAGTDVESGPVSVTATVRVVYNAAPENETDT